MNNQYSTDQLQIKLLNQLYKMNNQVQQISKTLIIYYLYDNALEDELPLHNLNTVAKVLLDTKINIDLVEDQDNPGVYRYSVAQKQTSPIKIREQKFDIEPSQEECQTQFNNIWLYEVEGGDTRVVVIPIQEGMIDISAIRNQTQRDEEEDKKVKKGFKDSALQNQELKVAHAKWNKTKEQNFKRRCAVAAEKHLKMFKIEAFLGTILQKTEKVSLCSLVQIPSQRLKNLEEFKGEFDNIFHVPADFIPQYIFHGYSDKKNKNAGKGRVQAEKEGVTTIFSVNQNKFGIMKMQALEERFFFPKDNIRTKIYQNMQKNENKAIIQVIQEFVGNWSRITVDVAFTFASVVRQVGSFLNSPDKQPEDPNNSMEGSSKQILPGLTFSQCFQKFLIDELDLPTKVNLERFYPSRLKKKKKQMQKGLAIPKSVQDLVFLHFFCKINREFMQAYSKRDIQTKSDPIEMLLLWKNQFKSIYELISEVNCTLLQTSAFKEVRCKDIKQFFNFLIFTFESLLKIKKITKRDLATHTELKVGFEQLRMRKEKILSYIVANKNNIRKDESTFYFDLLILIINQSSTKEMAKDLDDVYLIIHKNKAYRIADQYIHDNSILIEAIKSLALIAQKYQNLSQTKREAINIYEIEWKMAKLLKIVGQEEFAAQIYIKNRQFQFAHKAYQMAFVRLLCNRDEKAQKLLKWGKEFQKDFHFDLSFSYFRKAFSYAMSVSLKQQALKAQLDCNEKMRKEPTEEQLRKHLNFLEDGVILSYTSEINMLRIFKRLRICLNWEKDAKVSTILDINIDSAEAQSDFWRQVEGGEDKTSKISGE